ncbi:MAG: BatD family protein [Candidatus Omnitrophica bacterium]|nr:BatD family protein [Candidatus Omnitrophota bacterium]
MGRFRFLLLAASCLLAVGASPVLADQELKVGAQVDRTEVGAGEPLTYSITIAGSIRETPKVEMTAFEGFDLLSTGQSHEIQMQSGQVRSALVLTYTLAPTAPGTHLLGPVKIRYQGHEYQTQPIEIKVVPGKPRRAAPSRRLRRAPPPAPDLKGGVIL